ncbi:MAG: DUF4038 domain-containing protein, partial [Bacteroidota bacterium]
GSNGNMRRDVGLAWLALPLQVPLKAEVSDTILETQANVMTELTFVSKNNYTDPFNQVTLDVLFTDPTGNKLRVPAFWDGGNKWKARYSSLVQGIHSFRSICSDSNDTGMDNVTGKIEIEPYSGENILLKHGALKVANDKRHFAYKDDTPFFWLGDTWWMGLTERLTWPADFKELAADRSKKGFDVIQIVAGLYPDMPPFDERGKNEAGFPWEKDYSAINPEYFDAADKKIMYLVEQGFVPAIVGAWGYHLPWLGEKKMKQHWRYLIARWGALPVVWIAAGETTMPFYLSTTKDADEERQEKEWTEIIRYMRVTDPFHRLITTHPSRTARASVTDPTVLDFDMHQSGHGSAPAAQASLALEGWRDHPVMPVISGEARYEALAIPVPLPASAARQAFWAHAINAGFAGHTYGANGIWQVNGREHPYGKSPGGNNWGITPWNEAMRLPGSAQLSAAKHLIEALPDWNRLEPMPESVTSDSARVAPLCAGVGKQLRIVYLLAPGKVDINSLMPGGSYTANWFDPVSGEKMQNFILVADSVGRANAISPDEDQDWALTLVKKL